MIKPDDEEEMRGRDRPLYHGGIAGLAVGDLILPPTQTNARCCSDFGAEGRHSRQQVYVTPSFDLAALYAALVSGKRPGWVYDVRPIGALVPDQDTKSFSEPGWSFQCEGAVIVGIAYRCTFPETLAAWRTVGNAPLERFLASLLER